ncbi:Pre-mRNA processing factor 6-like protein [Intoshia linei]|uniref:Pre-mRNA-processing factor 6 n=1 Tax=Intoshia linei TaxID=1819745 RepID=A0A177B0Z7_9BILA|nr:Pre-mRNA processing factor 6-like protein [Intoshia linei]
MSIDNRKNRLFMTQDAPPGYVPGIGRGASGFTTRSDIGPARAAIDIPQAGSSPKDDGTQDLNDAYFDEFAGYGGSLCSNDPYEKDDVEADEVYDSIDRRMDEKRKQRREFKRKKLLEIYHKERPKIQQQFSDLKRPLGELSEDDWMSIPEVGDTRNKRQRNPRMEKFTPVPDSILRSAVTATENSMAVSSREQKFGGITTPFTGGLSTPVADIDMKKIGEARNTLMDIRLNQVSDSVTGQTVVDPKGYLTDLQSMNPNQGGDINDVKKARLLLKSVRETNPNHAPGWIASARVEEVTGKLQTAKNYVLKGIEKCPHSEDMILEAVRLLSREEAKSIIALSIRNLSNSVKIWVKSAELEDSLNNKKNVYRKALEYIPNSVRLWKLAVELEEKEDARIMLTRAVECCPTSVDLWLALAKLESYENARQVLNKSRQSIPTERIIWIAAAQLEESNDNIAMIKMLLERGLTMLRANSVEIKRDDWLKEAELCETAKSILTAKQIVQCVIDIDVDKEDRKSIWMDDAESFISHNCLECAREVYEHMVTKMPKKKSIWQALAYFEKNYGTSESFDNVLERAVKICPKADLLWLMRAKELWLRGKVDMARDVLKAAFEYNPYNEKIWLAAVKLESENNDHDRARKLLTSARAKAPTARVYIKSAKLEWCLDNIDEALKLVNDAMRTFSSEPKLWMILTQIKEQQKKFDEIPELFAKSIKKCPRSIDLWILASRFECRLNRIPKGRSILERSRLANPKTDRLWLESIRIEISIENMAVAKILLSKALQECPNSGILWAKTIEVETRAQSKARCIDALRRCEHDPQVLVAAARMFWQDRKINKAREWFHRAIKVDGDNGDSWCHFYKFELINGDSEKQAYVKNCCIKAEPHHGEMWCQVMKNIKN